MVRASGHFRTACRLVESQSWRALLVEGCGRSKLLLDGTDFYYPLYKSAIGDARVSDRLRHGRCPNLPKALAFY